MINKEKRMDSKIKHFNPMALREKYSVGNNTNSPFSSFWSDNDWNTRRTDILDDEQPVKKGIDHIQLASYRRAISNFVNIVTGRSDIPVKFQNRDESYTNGKTVVIGSKIDEKNFDPVVGLALHEGSHIKLSNFDFLKNLETSITEEIYLDAEKIGYSRYDVIGHVKNLLNYVEDRRIDWYVYSSSPGYKGYYQSMYNKYFHSNIIDKGIKSNEYTDLDWDSYIFRILNLTNENRRLDVLPDLDKIYKTIFGGGRVKKLQSTEDAFNVALEVYGYILDNVNILPEVSDENRLQNQEMDGQLQQALNDLDTENYHRERNGLPPLSPEEAGIDLPTPEDFLPESIDQKDFPTPTSDVELSEKQQKQLQNALDKQKKFNDGKPQKTGILSKKDSKMVQTMEDAGVDKVTAVTSVEQQGNYNYHTGEYEMTKSGCEVIYVKKLTQSMIDSNAFPYLLRKRMEWHGECNWLTNGISLGTKLGRKLQIRGESRDLKWTRQDKGRIDKRLIAELGFGNDRVFQTTFTEQYSDAFLHISVDASGSMSGEKWNNTMTSVVAILKAVDMISNVDVSVSFRSTHSSSRSYGGENPLVLVGYDSRVDNFNKVKKMFPSIFPGGTTPEGLCFEALLKDMIPSSQNRDSYFLNLSDGMPMFSSSNFNYYNLEALNHTKSQVDNFRKMGIKVLSYFVGDSYDGDRNMTDFKVMYGKDSEFINLKNVTQISKTMNTKFLEK